MLFIYFTLFYYYYYHFYHYCYYYYYYYYYYFSIWVFFHEHSRITGLTAGEGGGHFLTPHYHFHPLHRHLDISRAITPEGSPLHIASVRTRTGAFGFRAQVANHHLLHFGQ